LANQVVNHSAGDPAPALRHFSAMSPVNSSATLPK
jgi:hypothetical protein